VQEVLARVLNTYRDIRGRPVGHAALVRYADKSFGADLTDDEIDGIYEWVPARLLCGLGRTAVLHARGTRKQRDGRRVCAGATGRIPYCSGVLNVALERRRSGALKTG
jgi:hypothetical protein